MKLSVENSLANAAEFYGAAHQKPQQYSVITVLPPLRDTNKRNINILQIRAGKNIENSLVEVFPDKD